MTHYYFTLTGARIGNDVYDAERGVWTRQPPASDNAMKYEMPPRRHGESPAQQLYKANNAFLAKYGKGPIEG